MAKEKSKEVKLKRLYNQLKRVIQQPTHRSNTVTVSTGPNSTSTYTSTVMTLRGKLEQRIQTLENSK